MTPPPAKVLASDIRDLLLTEPNHCHQDQQSVNPLHSKPGLKDSDFVFSLPLEQGKDSLSYCLLAFENHASQHTGMEGVFHGQAKVFLVLLMASWLVLLNCPGGLLGCELPFFFDQTF